MTTRIWYVVSALDIGGPHPLIDLANGLAERGFDVTVWSLLDEMALADEFGEDVSVRTLGANSKIEIWKVAKLIGAVREEQPDVLHSFFFFDNMVARGLKLLFPATTTVCGVMAVLRDQPWYRRLAEDLLITVPDYYVSNSKAGKEYIVQRGAPAESVEVIYNGRSAETYGGPIDSEYLLSELGLPRDAYILGNVARLVETKGHADLLTAVSRLRRAGRDVHALIVGDGPHREALEEKATELGCRDHVTFAGMRDDVPALLDVMDAFVFPTYQEGLPGAIIEAMLAGLPIVSTPVDGCAELLTDAKTGVFVSPGNPDEIVSEVTSLMDDSGRAETLGENARKEAVSSFSTEERLARFERFYDRILSKEPTDQSVY